MIGDQNILSIWPVNVIGFDWLSLAGFQARRVQPQRLARNPT
jgi:hypothetical protein